MSYLFPVLRIISFISTIEKITIVANVCNVQWNKCSGKSQDCSFFAKSWSDGGINPVFIPGISLIWLVGS